MREYTANFTVQSEYSDGASLARLGSHSVEKKSVRRWMPGNQAKSWMR